MNRLYFSSEEEKVKHRERMIMQAWCAMELLVLAAWVATMILPQHEASELGIATVMILSLWAGIVLASAKEGVATFSALHPLALPYWVYLSAKKKLASYTYLVRRSHR